MFRKYLLPLIALALLGFSIVHVVTAQGLNWQCPPVVGLAYPSGSRFA